MHRPAHSYVIAEWTDLIRTSPPAKHMELVNWLKSEHGLGHGHANALVTYTLAQPTVDRPGPHDAPSQNRRASVSAPR